MTGWLLTMERMRNHEQGAIVIDTTQGVRLADEPPLGEYWKGPAVRTVPIIADSANPASP